MKKILRFLALVLLGRRKANSILRFGFNLKVIVLRFIRLAKTGFRRRPPSYPIKKFGDDNHQIFFGYYDISPISHNENLLLALRTPQENEPQKTETEIEVGYFELNKEASIFLDIGKTSTWNWQQGCRLQWFPEENSRFVLYNRLVEGQYGCVKQDIKSKELIKTYERPIYSVSRDGSWGLSVNFSRLHRLRPGYGYMNLPDKSEGELAPETDGIWRIDLKTGEEKFLFSVAEIASIKPLDSMKDSEHYFNHILFNPTGSRFLFFHVWLKYDKRFARLITCDINGENRYPLINEGYVSHYNWKSNNEIIAYSKHKNTRTNFYIYKNGTAIKKILGEGILDQDGHPSFSPDGSLILTDTYPDKFAEQHLLIYKLDTKKLYCLGSFFSPFRFRGEVRCDLHPRWSPTGRYIAFDSAHEDKRATYLLDTRLFQASD